MVLATESNCGLAALCLTHHLDPAYIFQNASYPCTHQFMIIDQEYIYHPNTPFLSRFSRPVRVNRAPCIITKLVALANHARQKFEKTHV